jgi:DNA-binding MarR family transcriptional regulator
MMELIVREDGLLTERSIRELATWYSDGGGEQESFEAHLMMLRAYAALTTSAQRGRRTSLSIERFSLLRLLYRAPDKRLLMSEISRALGVSATSVSKLVNALSDLNLVRRVEHAGDKRRAWAEITPDGARLVEENIPVVRESTVRRWRGLTRQEKRMLVHLLAKVLLSSYSQNAEEQLRALEAGLASSVSTSAPTIA